MVLQLIEGFETRDNSARPFWYRQSSSFVAGRFGGYCIQGGGAVVIAMPQAADVVILGHAAYLHASGNSLNMDFITEGNNNYNLRLNINRDDRYARLYRGGGTLLAVSPSPVIPSVFSWNYIEVRARVADVGGFLDLRINGTTVMSFVGDTFNSGVTGGKIVQVTVDGYQIDDLYLCDSTGSEFNDFLGEIQIETIVPNASGAASSLTPSTGQNVDSWQLVDELPASETDYVQSAIVGAQQLWRFTDPVITSGQILAVQPEIAISKANAGPAAAKIMERVDGVERLSDPIAAQNMVWKHVGPRTRDPSGAVWTPAKVAAAEFGIEVV